MTDISFVTVDAQEIQNQLIRDFEQALGVVFYPGDERRVFLQQQVQVLVGLWGTINETAKQNLLRYAQGAVLDALAELTGVTRLAAQPARVQLRYTLSDARPQAVVIPLGTRVTPDGALYFASTQQLTIPSGQLSGDVLAQATAAGESHNGFAPGQITGIVDPVAYVASVTNTDSSSGGTDAESDDSLRERCRISPASFSSAGPEKAYIYWAKSSDLTIADVSVSSPSPGEVNVYVLQSGGQMPSQVILDKVDAAVNDRYRRPLTDHVTVLPATAISFDVELTYYISSERATEETAIRATVEACVDTYALWQSSKLGRAINPDYLRQLMLNAGASRIQLVAPVYATIDADSVAILNVSTVVYGGQE